MPTAAVDASDSGGLTTSCTSLLLASSVMGEKDVALNWRDENWICLRETSRVRGHEKAGFRGGGRVTYSTD